MSTSTVNQFAVGIRPITFQAQTLHRAHFDPNMMERAKATDATRFCMGAAWRAPKDRDVEAVAEFVKTVKATGLEACALLGIPNVGHAETLRDAVQTLCFVAGDNSIFYGEKLLTTGNLDVDAGSALPQRLSLKTGHPVPRP